MLAKHKICHLVNMDIGQEIWSVFRHSGKIPEAVIVHSGVMEMQFFTLTACGEERCIPLEFDDSVPEKEFWLRYED